MKDVISKCFFFSLVFCKLCLSERIWVLKPTFLSVCQGRPLVVAGTNYSIYCSQTAKDHRFEGQSCFLMMMHGRETFAFLQVTSAA